MQADRGKDLLDKWRNLDLSFMTMSKTPPYFNDSVYQEFGCIRDVKRWTKKVQYH